MILLPKKLTAPGMESRERGASFAIHPRVGPHPQSGGDVPGGHTSVDYDRMINSASLDLVYRDVSVRLHTGRCGASSVLPRFLSIRKPDFGSRPTTKRPGSSNRMPLTPERHLKVHRIGALTPPPKRSIVRGDGDWNCAFGHRLHYRALGILLGRSRITPANVSRVARSL